MKLFTTGRGKCVREHGLSGFGKRRGGGEEQRVGREADRCIDG